MTIDRIKSPDWAYAEVVTSSQLNALDANITNALDKRPGHTDELGSQVTVPNGGSLEFAAGGELTVSPGAVVDATLDGTSVVSVEDGGEVHVTTDGVLTVDSSATVNMTLGIDGAVNLVSGGAINAGAGGAVNINSSGTLNVAGLGNFQVAAGAVFLVDSIASFSGDVHNSGTVYIATGGLRYGTPISQSIWVPMTNMSGLQSVNVAYGAPVNVPPSNTNGWPNSILTSGPQGSFNFYSVAFPDWALPQGSTLTSINLFLRIKTGHGFVPAIPAQYWAYKMSMNSGTPNPTVVYLNSSTTSSGGGSASPLTSSVAAYEQSGNIQMITYTCNQNNVISKDGLTSYGVIIRDEDSQSGNIFHGFRLNFTNVAQLY